MKQRSKEDCENGKITNNLLHTKSQASSTHKIPFYSRSLIQNGGSKYEPQVLIPRSGRVGESKYEPQALIPRSDRVGVCLAVDVIICSFTISVDHAYFWLVKRYRQQQIIVFDFMLQSVSNDSADSVS